MPDWLKAALGIGGVALLAPYLSQGLNPGADSPGFTAPNYLDQFGKTGQTPGVGGGAGGFGGFSNAGLNPGWMQAGVPNYSPEMTRAAPQQNQYSWGTKPYMYQMSDLANYSSPQPAVGPIAPPRLF
jgi:hypothetical protein